MAVLILIIYFFASSLITSIAANSDEIQKMAIDEQMNRAKISKLPEIERNLSDFDSNKNKIDVILDPDAEVAFIKDLELLAEQTGNKISLSVSDDKSSPAPPVKSKGTDKNDIKSNLPYDSYISMKINLEGSYFSLVNFVHKLENYNYYLKIVSIESKKQLPAQTMSNSLDIFSYASTNNNKSKTASQKEIISSAIGIIIYVKK